MPLRVVVQVTCARHPERSAKARKVSIDGVGGLLDMCPHCSRELLDPIRELLKKHGRADQSEVPPEYAGQVADAWPSARGAKNTSVPTRGKKSGKAKPKISPRTGFRFPCPVAWCNHPGLNTVSGITWHVNHTHPGLTVPKLLDHVTECGLCEPGQPVINGQVHLGRHVTARHGDDLDIAGKGAVLALIGVLRRTGDPHGTLKAMDDFALSDRSAEGAGSQLTLEDATDDQANDQLLAT